MTETLLTKGSHRNDPKFFYFVCYSICIFLNVYAVEVQQFVVFENLGLLGYVQREIV